MTAADRLRELLSTATPDHRAIAVAERDVWAELRETASGKLPRREHYFRDTFGVNPPTSSMFRQGLLGHEPWCAPLWKVAASVSLRKAYGICLALRDRADRAEEARRLGEHPEEAKLFREQRPRACKTVECSPGEARELRSRVRALVQEFAREKIESLEDPAVASDAVLEFEVHVEVAYTDFLRKLQRIRGNNGAQSIIAANRTEFRRACEFLGIKVPARGGTIDMEAARKAHRKLSAQFHPDKTNGNEQMTGQYLEIQRAWEIISAYQP